MFHICGAETYRACSENVCLATSFCRQGESKQLREAMLPLRHSHCAEDEEGPRTWALREMALRFKFSWGSLQKNLLGRELRSSVFIALTFASDIGIWFTCFGHSAAFKQTISLSRAMPSRIPVSHSKLCTLSRRMPEPDGQTLESHWHRWNTILIYSDWTGISEIQF